MPARTKPAAQSTRKRSHAVTFEKTTLSPVPKKTTPQKHASGRTAAKSAPAQREELRAMLTDLGRQVSELSAGADRLLKRLA